MDIIKDTRDWPQLDRVLSRLEPHSEEFYRVKLTAYMLSEFPERKDCSDFIEPRAEMAAETFLDVMQEGGDVQEAEHEADEVLFTGIRYSPFRLVSRVVRQFFPADDEAEEHDFTLQMLERCEPFITEYPLQDGTFPGSRLEELLYTRIIGEITVYLEQNGMA